MTDRQSEIDSESLINSLEPVVKKSRIRDLAKRCGKLAGATVIVCTTATPFVYLWADKIGDNVEPVSGGLNDVSEKTEDLKQVVEAGGQQISGEIGNLRITVDDLTPSSTTTSTIQTFVTVDGGNAEVSGATTSTSTTTP